MNLSNFLCLKELNEKAVSVCCGHFVCFEAMFPGLL